MYFVYVLYSLTDQKLYKGYTSNLQKRLIRHNSGGNQSTSKRKPFVLVHVEQFETKSEALKRELYLKSIEGGTKLKSYLKEMQVLNADEKLNV